MRKSLSLVIAVALLSACKSNDPATAAYWMDRLEKRDQRDDAIKQLGKMKAKEAVPALTRLLKQEGDWQPDAAWALGEIGDASVVATLIDGIDYQVGTSNDRKARNKHRINANTVRALASLKAKDSVKAMLKLMDSTSEPTVREACLRAMGSLGNFEVTSRLTDVALNDREPYLRKVAIQALGELRDPAAIPTLVKMLFIELPGISFYNEARLSLIQMGEAAVPALVKTMKRENKDVESIRLGDGGLIGEGAIEAKAGSVLGYLKAVSAEPLMVEAVNKLWKQFKSRDDSKPVFASIPGAIIEFCYSLGALGSMGSAKTLTAIAVDPEMVTRVGASEALTQIGDRSAVKPLLDAAKKGNLDSRKAVLTAISRLGDGTELTAFDALAKTGDKTVPNNVLSEIIKGERVRLVAAGDCKSDLACWRGKLADQDPRVRDRAVWQLGWTGDKAVFDDMLKAAQDNDPMVRMAAVLSLRRIADPDLVKLKELSEGWSKRLDYQMVNMEIQRLIALVESRRK